MQAQLAYCPTVDHNDLLSEVLQDLRLTRASYGRSELTAPWGIEVPYKEGIRFHFVAEGSCWMLSGTQKPVWLEAGDVVLLPHGTAHVITDQPLRRPKSLAEIGPQLIGNATYRLSIGAATIMARLADIIMTRIVRAWVETRPSDLSGWLAAIRDPQIGVALARIHRSPGESWSVDSLSSVAGLSRSIFSERFTAVCECKPGYTTLQIDFDDDALRQLRVGGTFQTSPEGAEALLTMLHDGFGMAIRRDGYGRVYIEGSGK